MRRFRNRLLKNKMYGKDNIMSLQRLFKKCNKTLYKKNKQLTSINSRNFKIKSELF